MTIKRTTKAGQAMAELLLGIIALVVIMVGTITFGEGGYHWLSSMVEAAANAWAPAISDRSLQIANACAPLPFIQTWDNGRDQIAYTMDDQRIPGNVTTFFAAATRSLSSPIDYPHYNEPYITENFALNLDPNTTTTRGWLMGQSLHRWALGRIDRQNGRQPIDFGSAFQSLVYGSDSITLQSETYLPPLTNLQ